MCVINSYLNHFQEETLVGLHKHGSPVIWSIIKQLALSCRIAAIYARNTANNNSCWEHVHLPMVKIGEQCTGRTLRILLTNVGN